ncbi:NAD(P)H-quinone dehydrogenase [Salsipaludibacter albus]|uniref:NAD(P)H-quinone dehydrogenase n=1 Tax=Salsipaludibacter albus TaxID=2849650 RepID=UPI001EE3F07F|nr:NAD(P)H-quinone dehydrogenase [Salsipaludibacter albus]
MTNQRSRIVILGGGPAGYEAALVAAELDADVTVIADEGLGGNSVLWDCVPSKALIVAAEAMGWIERSHEMGVHQTGAGSGPTIVDFPTVGQRVLGLGANQSEDIEQKVCGQAGVRLVRGRGRVSGYHEVTADLHEGGSETFEADFVLVATGSTARVLPFFEPDGERVLTGQQVYDLPELPEHLVVVGSGATGAEFAHAFVRFGTKVTLVSSRDLILPTEDPDAAQVIEGVFERRGMTILRNARAASCTNHGDHVEVGLVDGSSITGSHVLFTVGQVPVSSDLGLELAGVEPNEWGGIEVDGVGRTSCRWIYAAGDVVGRIMLASVAAMQGRVAMWHALGQAVTPIRWEAVASTIFTDPEVATVGLSREEAEARGIPVTTARLDFRGNPRAKMAGHTDGFVKVHAMVGSGMVIGGVVVASSASDLVQPLAVAVQNRLTVSQLANTVSVYPSMQGSVTEAARMLMAKVTGRSTGAP